jgi:CheY-like chemotaxis protein
MKQTASSETMRAVLIEDSEIDLRDICLELQEHDGLTVEPIIYENPDETIRKVTAMQPDVILVDFRLVKSPKIGDVIPTEGSTLAVMFKEKARMPNTPVFLVSHGSLARKDPLLHLKIDPRFFDELLLKEDIQSDSRAVVKKIRAVVSGYRRLAAKRNRTRAALLDLLDAGDADSNSLTKSEPPSALVTGSPWDVTEVAQWIRHTLMAYPGILYDDLTAACFLGLSLGAFTSKRITAFFDEARYRGPFCDEEDYWWKSRLLSLATAYLVEMGEAGPPVSFGWTWKKKHKGKIALSQCNSSGEEPAECVCYLLREPVKREHSLPYRPDRRPAVMDEARVSHRAVREARGGFDPDLVAPDARPILNRIRKRAK